MPKEDECLTLDQLKMFVGVTDAPSQLRQHLETCRNCCEQLERLQSTDPVTSMSMLGRASQGDNEAWHRLVDTYGGLVYLPSQEVDSREFSGSPR